MKYFSFLLAVLCYLMVYQKAFAQDSIAKKLLEASTDTAKVGILCDASFDYLNVKIDSALYFANEALRISQNGNDLEGASRSLNALGNVLLQTGQEDKALETYLMALKKAEMAEAEPRIAQSLSNIGTVYLNRGDYRLPLDYFNKAKSINEKHQDFDKLTINFVNMGICYQYLDMPDSALFLLNEALEISRKQNLTELENSVLYYMGKVYEDKRDLKMAKNYFLSSMEKSALSKNKTLLSSALLGIGHIYQKEQLDSALLYTKMAYEIAAENQYNVMTLNAAGSLYEIFLAQNKTDSSLKYLKIKYDLKEAFFNNEKTKQIQNLTLQEQFRQIEIANEKELQRKLRIQNMQYLGIASFIIALFALLILLSRSKIKPQIIEYIGLVALLIFFEFLSILLDPLIAKWANHKPIFNLIILVSIAIVLVPCHHFLEKWIKNKLVKKKN